MLYVNKLNLQLFADGGGDGASTGEGAPTGDNSADAGQQRLLELGVPADKIRKRAKKEVAELPEGAVRTESEMREQQTNERAANADTHTEEPETSETRMSWDEIMADPEYNKQMQATIRARLKSAHTAEETLAKVAPALEVLARKHNLDPKNIDYEALNNAINNDDGFYEERAVELGVSVETAKKIDQQERDTARQQREQQRTLEQQKIQQHIQRLEQQGNDLKKVFPKFDLREELKNPAFARMTAPNIGISVEDAYYAVHRNELQTAAMQVAAQKTAQKLSNAIQAGGKRPVENGTSGRSASVSTFDYSKASKEQREALKRRIREAKARGEKLYPGG